MSSDIPRFAHDCDACHFLGRHNEYDLYICPQNGHPDYIARMGDDGPYYASLGRDVLLSVVASGSTPSVTTAALIEAMKRHDAEPPAPVSNMHEVLVEAGVPAHVIAEVPPEVLEASQDSLYGAVASHLAWYLCNKDDGVGAGPDENRLWRAFVTHLRVMVYG